MKMRNYIIVGLSFFFILFASGFFFVVDQTKQVIVLQFGEPRAVHQSPGLKFKLPFIQNVVYYDSRVLNLDPAQEEVILRDQKRIVVDSIVRYMIKDPLKFFQTTRTELALNDRLGRIVNSSVRGVIAQYQLNDLLSDDRDKIMAEIFENVREDQDTFGIEIVDLRLKRTELTPEVQSNVFDRMRTEREREANLLRAEGQEISQKIKATADREKIEIIAEAEKQSNILKGKLMQILLKTVQLLWLYLLIVIFSSILKTLRAPTKYNFYNEKTFCFISFQYFFYNPQCISTI